MFNVVIFGKYKQCLCYFVMCYNPTNLRLPAVLSTPGVKSIFILRTGLSIPIPNCAAVWPFLGGGYFLMFNIVIFGMFKHFSLLLCK